MSTKRILREKLKAHWNELETAKVWEVLPQPEGTNFKELVINKNDSPYILFLNASNETRFERLYGELDRHAYAYAKLLIEEMTFLKKEELFYIESKKEEKETENKIKLKEIEIANTLQLETKLKIQEQLLENKYKVHREIKILDYTIPKFKDNTLDKEDIIKYILEVDNFKRRYNLGLEQMIEELKKGCGNHSILKITNNYKTLIESKERFNSELVKTLLNDTNIDFKVWLYRLDLTKEDTLRSYYQKFELVKELSGVKEEEAAVLYLSTMAEDRSLKEIWGNYLLCKGKEDKMDVDCTFRVIHKALIRVKGEEYIPILNKSFKKEEKNYERKPYKRYNNYKKEAKDSPKNSTSEEKKIINSKSIKCERCKRLGHSENTCYSKFYEDGSRIKNNKGVNNLKKDEKFFQKDEKGFQSENKPSLKYVSKDTDHKESEQDSKLTSHTHLIKKDEKFFQKDEKCFPKSEMKPDLKNVSKDPDHKESEQKSKPAPHTHLLKEDSYDFDIIKREVMMELEEVIQDEPQTFTVPNIDSELDIMNVEKKSLVKNIFGKEDVIVIDDNNKLKLLEDVIQDEPQTFAILNIDSKVNCMDVEKKSLVKDVDVIVTDDNKLKRVGEVKDPERLELTQHDKEELDGLLSSQLPILKETPNLKVTFGDLEVEALLDTQSQCSIIAEKVVERIKNKIVSKDTRNFVGVGGVVQGRVVKTQISIEDLNIHEEYIFGVVHSNVFQVILGWDFIDKFNLSQLLDKSSKLSKNLLQFKIKSVGDTVAEITEKKEN